MGDNSRITGANADIVDESGNGIKDKQHDDHSGGLPHLVRRPLGFKKGLSIASLNINGLRTHFDEAKVLIQNLGIHILALIETKLDPSFPKELTVINGYQQELLERTCHGEGVSIYVRDPIHYKRRTDLPMDDLELICIEIETPRNKPFLLLARYTPSSDSIQTFHKLDKVFAFLDSEYKEIIFLGDANYDLTNKPGAQTVDNNTNHLCNLFELYNFLQLIKEPTRVTLATSSIIDHTATTRGRNIAESGVHKVSISDHYMVFCVRKFDGALLKDRKITKTRSMKHFGESAFLAEVSNICWEGALS